MANVNVAVLIPVDVYLKFIRREIRPSELKMVLQPVESFDGITPIKEREAIYKGFQLPEWWKQWYANLERSDRLKYASIIRDRLNQLLGNQF